MKGFKATIEASIDNAGDEVLLNPKLGRPGPAIYQIFWLNIAPFKSSESIDLRPGFYFIGIPITQPVKS